MALCQLSDAFGETMAVQEVEATRLTVNTTLAANTAAITADSGLVFENSAITEIADVAKRWALNLVNAEGGSNAGSDLAITAFADNGTSVARYPLEITRANGEVCFMGGAPRFLPYDASLPYVWNFDFVTNGTTPIPVACNGFTPGDHILLTLKNVGASSDAGHAYVRSVSSGSITFLSSAGDVGATYTVSIIKRS